MRAGFPSPGDGPDLSGVILERVEVRRPFLTEIQQRRAARVRIAAGVGACVVALAAGVLGLPAAGEWARSMRWVGDDRAIASAAGSGESRVALAEAEGVAASSASGSRPPDLETALVSVRSVGPMAGALPREVAGVGGVGGELARGAWAFTRAMISPEPTGPRRAAAGNLSDQLESLLSGDDAGWASPR
ncbi:MAG: hypothetical protein JNK35_10150 [Phycisphaerae bacterium]|nr:hypothetical protein [Phycisphaerae bacterium]